MYEPACSEFSQFPHQMSVSFCSRWKSDHCRCSPPNLIRPEQNLPFLRFVYTRRPSPSREAKPPNCLLFLRPPSYFPLSLPSLLCTAFTSVLSTFGHHKAVTSSIHSAFCRSSIPITRSASLNYTQVAESTQGSFPNLHRSSHQGI